MRFEEQVKWMIVWITCIQHAWWGMLLIFSPAPTTVTAIATLSHTIPNHRVLGALFLFVAIVAMRGVVMTKMDIKAFLHIIPQQLVLTYSAAGTVIAMVNSAFADGVVRPRTFIMADQVPAVLFVIGHTIAVVLLYGGTKWPWRKSSR